MHRVNLRIASLKNANAQNCNLDHSCLAGANLGNNFFSYNFSKNKSQWLIVIFCLFIFPPKQNKENCDLSGSDLNEVNLRGANLKGTRFDLIHTPLHMFYLTS